jgi:hypothetical protein
MQIFLVSMDGALTFVPKAIAQKTFSLPTWIQTLFWTFDQETFLRKTFVRVPFVLKLFFEIAFVIINA